MSDEAAPAPGWEVRRYCDVPRGWRVRDNDTSDVLSPHHERDWVECSNSVEPTVDDCKRIIAALIGDLYAEYGATSGAGYQLMPNRRAKATIVVGPTGVITASIEDKDIP